MSNLSREPSFKGAYLMVASLIGVFLVTPANGQPGQQDIEYSLSREIRIQPDDGYLNFPVRGWTQDYSAGSTFMRVLRNGESLAEFSITPANVDPDWWAFFPVETYQGEVLTVELVNPEYRESLEQVFSSAELPGHEELYKESYRPQVHFSTRRGWVNDPNGLIYYNGEWHLFYQYGPYGWRSNNKHWGHAVSRDLVHWEELPLALHRPDRRYSAFSGGAVVDPENRASKGVR